jgi:hypothetical protein
VQKLVREKLTLVPYIVRRERESQILLASKRKGYKKNETRLSLSTADKICKMLLSYLWMFKKYMEQIFVVVGHIWLLYAWPLDGSLFPFSLLFSLSTHMVNEPATGRCPCLLIFSDVSTLVFVVNNDVEMMQTKNQ